MAHCTFVHHTILLLWRDRLSFDFEQIESTFWNACIYLIEKHDLSEEKLIDFFLSQLEKDAKGKDEKQRGIDSLIYAYLQVKYTQNKKWH